MDLSQKKMLLLLAVLCVFSGLLKLDSTGQFTGTSTATKQVSKNVFNSNNYKECLSNLDGLEHALVEAAVESEIDPKLLLAVMMVESECTLVTSSGKGAVGLMQILPSTARSVGEFDAHKPQENIMAGAKYLRELKDRFNQDLSLTLAAYNAGPTAVRRYKGIPPYRETRNYVSKVLKVYEGYKL